MYDPNKTPVKINRQPTEDLLLANQVEGSTIDHPKWWGDRSDEKLSAAQRQGEINKQFVKAKQ